MLIHLIHSEMIRMDNAKVNELFNKVLPHLMSYQESKDEETLNKGINLLENARDKMDDNDENKTLVGIVLTHLSNHKDKKDDKSLNDAIGVIDKSRIVL